MIFIRLYHGADLASAMEILNNGIDAAKAKRYNAAGEFWATTDRRTADFFALTNPAGGKPARLEFDLPKEVIQDIMAIRPRVAFYYSPTDYEFLPPAFEKINQHRANVNVVLVP